MVRLVMPAIGLPPTISDAVMLELPPATPVAKPDVFTVATFVFEDDQVTWLLTSC
jgi:hypothetical protein